VTEKEAVHYELLVLRCRQRQRDALEELVRTWDRPLRYYIRRLMGDEHESLQILQQTWVKVLQGLGGLREPRKLPLWLYSIARKTALSHLRTKYSEQAFFRHPAEVLEIQDGGPDPAFDDAEQVHYGLGRLSLIHREVLTLFFLLNTIGLCALLSGLYRGQFRSQETLLEIQYRLAELAERLDKQQVR
jgi:DNA-directed RNA polymerase specialized sigma24 family protein